MGELVVSVIQAKDLETSPVTNTVDSYVKLWLSPGPENKHQTKVRLLPLPSGSLTAKIPDLLLVGCSIMSSDRAQILIMMHESGPEFVAEKNCQVRACLPMMYFGCMTHG